MLKGQKPLLGFIRVVYCFGVIVGEFREVSWSSESAALSLVRLVLVRVSVP